MKEHTSHGFEGFIPESSNVQFFGYNPENNTLRVEFVYGNYHYFGVPHELYEDLKEAESAGSFIARHVKGKFDHEKE